ncbi:S-adenosyl-L-methionine-dependent methyltransferase [Mycena galopus ATCC 62051]|nr:S-adenosyl-L-methionine-dependent methyltransferase [Mycena galopus ATCC 62051]
MFRLRVNHARRKTVLLCYRQYSTRPQVTPALPDDVTLPPRPLWRQYFPVGLKFGYRVFLANPTTAATVADAFIPQDSVDKVVVEIFPGPGQLTRALLALPRSRIKKLIVLEHADMYLKYLKPLESVDDRIKVIPLNGESWSSYQALEEMKMLDDVATIPWDQGVHPQLHFVSHLVSNVYGEQFISQLFRGMPDQQWLFKYGRVPMSVVMSEYIYKRILGESVSIRCKLSMISAAVASFKEAVPSKVLQPYQEHFYPKPRASKDANTPDSRRKAGTPFVAVNITPLEEQAIQPGLLVKWDYCLRHLYVNRATPIKNALPYLAPNAQSLLKGTDIDPKKHVRELTVGEWSQLVTAFHAWPFAPEDLSITDTIGIDEEKRG